MLWREACLRPEWGALTSVYHPVVQVSEAAVSHKVIRHYGFSIEKG